MEVMGNHFEKDNDYMILHPSKSAKIGKIFNNLNLFSGFEEYGDGITVEKFVNTTGE